MSSTTRKALVVGIDFYQHLRNLGGCVNDARAVNAVLERNFDDTRNFDSPRLLISRDASEPVNRAKLRRAVVDLFKDPNEIALLYFSGHGYLDETGGFLCASDAEDGDDGLALQEVMAMANSSPATNKIIILDSCHSGSAAAGPGDREQQANIHDGVTILAASTPQQAALERAGSGVFTGLMVDALKGAAANLIGEITPGSVYAHIDQSLGSWDQRPVFKTNVQRFVSLRRTQPPIPLAELRQLTALFPNPQHRFALDPSYEFDRSAEQSQDPSIVNPDPSHVATFKVLQHYRDVNLVQPVGAEHMYFAAMNSTACELTSLGQHYWNLVKQDRL
ncbi:caspase family protein [Brachybacterium sp. UNK5269]|uniref:caspase family protein n=1 Tax=Brachybacterium sp. UNK5269 TaxID=3408576 RepID=UPI003BB063B4